MKFNPTLEYTDIFNFNKLYNHTGSKKFYGTYDEEQYNNFLHTINELNISEDDWPYRNLEEDFYKFNSYGYRTHEFDLFDTFDMTIGCSYVEGLGIRYSESWIQHYENHYKTPLFNLGKGGATNDYIKLTIFGWITSGRKLPKNLLIMWTEPNRRTYIVDHNSPLHLNIGWNPAKEREEPLYKDISSSFETFLYSHGDEMWSNHFVQNFVETNLLCESNGINVHNFVIKNLWPEFDVDDFKKYTNRHVNVLTFDSIDGGWHTFLHYNKPIFPAADGVHVGPKHHVDIFNQIKKIVSYE